MSALINGGRPFLTRDSADVGLSTYRVRALRADGGLRDVFRGVVVDARVPESRDLRAVVLDLVRPKGAVFYGETVAWLHGLDVFRPGDRHQLVPRCVVPHGSGRARRAGVVCHEGYIAPRDVETIDGLQVTTAVRTVTDLLRTSFRPYALVAADAFAAAGLIDPDAVRGALVMLRGYPGIRQARVLAELIDPLVESSGETLTRLRLVDAGLPAPTSQIVLRSRSGVVVARLDMGYEEQKIAVEFDGRRDHSSDEDRAHDAARRRAVAEQFGWRVLVVTSEDIWGDGPPFEAQVAEMLGIGSLPRLW
ncbi:hypothetical protein [Solicola sp. PLA-1-18]|uniref:hypothetical protein n=1 Tax=Solicola sp. PLA-1-18 TaxID=3380532 RepID=UPI003B7CF742